MEQRTMFAGAAAIALATAVLLGSVTLRGAFAQKAASRTQPAAGAVAVSDPPEQEKGEQAEEQEQGEQGGQEKERAYTSSIQIPEEQPGQSEQSEQSEAAALHGMARVTADQARIAAVEQFHGATVSAVTLENENGSLVYSILLTSNGKAQDVKVDAGNAKVLHVEAGGAEAHEAGDGEGSEGVED